jgi:Tol biopolymer transport system component
MRVSVVHTEGTEVGGPAISPDGRRIAYRARGADGIPMIWVRDIESVARSLAGTENGRFPFWSPDSRDLGFVAGGLKRIPADGGPVQELVPPPVRFGGAWAPDGTIVFAVETALLRVSSAGGVPEPVTVVPGEDWGHYWPSFLPDGRRFLFTAKLWTRSAEASKQGVYLGSLDSHDVRWLLPDLTSAVYAPPGYLVFVREGTLTAVPFDLESGTVTGQAVLLDEPVAVDATYYLSGISAALDGTLAVRPPPATDLGYETQFESELRLLGRDGSLSRVVGDRHEYRSLALAPDGARAAVSIIDARAGSCDLWLIDIQTGRVSPITTTRGFADAPVWSPDGTRLAYALQPPAVLDDIYVRDFRNGQDEQLIDTSGVWEHPLAWSADGDHLLVAVRRAGELNDLYVWSFDARSLVPFVRSPWSEGSAAFSPDGRYMVYSSSESGRGEVYVTTFPKAGARWPLTTEGARPMSWSQDGREILVATRSGQVVGYPVTTAGGSFSAGSPSVLVRGLGSVAYYASASRDHSHILVRVNPDAERDKVEIRLLFGWANGLRR